MNSIELKFQPLKNFSVVLIVISISFSILDDSTLFYDINLNTIITPNMS